MQEQPTPIRLWKEVAPRIHEQAKMYHGNLNATINLVLMRGLGFQDWQIEQECAKNVRRRK